MHALLHGNRHAARDGSVSPQLIGRIDVLLRAKEHGFYVDHIFFFANDVYPNGVRATDFVWDRLTNNGFLPEQLTVEGVADTTRAEVEAFIRSRVRKGSDGPALAVTSFYHAHRCRFLLRRTGCEARLLTSRAFAARDLVLELPKLALECTSVGQQLKKRLRARSPQIAA